MNPALRLLMAAAGGGGAAPPEKVQSQFAAASTLTLGATPTDGNLLVVCTGGSTAPATFTSLSTLGYTMDVSKTHNNGWWSSVWSKIASSDSATITVTEGAGSRPHLACFEFDQALAFDVSATANGYLGPGGISGLAVGPTATLASSPGVAVVVVQREGNSGGDALSNSFTLAHNNTDGAVGFKVLSTTDPVSTVATWDTYRNAAVCLATFT